MEESLEARSLKDSEKKALTSSGGWPGSEEPWAHKDRGKELESELSLHRRK